MTTIPISKSEIEACQEAVQNFRVNELHQLVSQFKYPKLGKKQELVNRAITILNNPKFQLQAVQKVREIQASIRVRDANQPYTTTTSGAVNGTVNMNNQQPQHPYQMNPPNMAAGLHAAAAYNNGFMNAALANFAAYGHFPGAAHQHVSHNFGHHSMPLLNQQQVVPMHRSTNGTVTNLRTVELPFYDFIKPVFQMTELPAYPVPTRPGEARFSAQFGILPEDIAKLSYADDKELPRYELQLRVFLLETTAEQQDAFPPNTTVRLDEAIVNLPPIIPTNKPNAEQKRYPRPVNLTPYCRPPRGRERPHRLSFEWNGDKRAWAFTVTLVRRVDTEILLERMRKNPQATRPFDTTKTAIIKRLNGEDEDDVQMDSLKISLIDPLSKTRIWIPARAKDCTHLQTFDLKSYLMMNEKRPGWTCPVCDKNAIYSKLIIEEYFEQMLKNVGQSIEEVELLRNGTWRLPKTDNTVSLDSDEEPEEGMVIDDEDDIIIVEKAAKGEKKKTEKQKMDSEKESTLGNAAKEQQRKEMDIDIICLSSDDEDEQLASAIAASSMKNRPSDDGGTPNSNVSASNSGRNGVIVPSQQCKSPKDAGQQNFIRQQQSIQNGGSPLQPTLQANGQQTFRPTIDELAKTQVAQHLALFLQNIYAKNNQFNMQENSTANNPH